MNAGKSNARQKSLLKDQKPYELSRYLVYGRVLDESGSVRAEQAVSRENVDLVRTSLLQHFRSSYERLHVVHHVILQSTG